MPEKKEKKPQETTFIGKCNFRGNQRVFGVKTKDRRQHMYVIGKTGVGKTVLLKNLALQDIRAGRGICIIDPHGEFVEEVLDQIPPERMADVIYFNPVDSEYPIGFNVLEVPDRQYKHLVVSDLLGIFTKIWANVWSARMEYILQNCIMALLDTPGTTLLGIPRLLVDKDYRQKIVANIKDPVVRSFWVHEYETWRDQFRNEAIVPIQNKVNQFLNTSFIRNIVGQAVSTLKIPDVMNEGKILLVNVSKGKVGEDNSALLGAMIITKIQLAAMERVRIVEHERKDFYLYVDEFQNFATDSFASILSEARKYRLNLILAHQYVGQLVTDVSTKVRDAVFGNVGTMISFRVGAADAEELEKEFDPEFMMQDLINLPNYNIYLKLMVDGVTSRPFSATTLKPLQFETDPTVRDSIIKLSRDRYARARQEVEEKITAWSGFGGEATTTVLEGANSSGFIETPCWNCGKTATVPFKPDGKRPVYCMSCLKQIEDGKLIPLPERMPRVGNARFSPSLEGVGIEFAMRDGGMSPARSSTSTRPSEAGNIRPTYERRPMNMRTEAGAPSSGGTPVRRMPESQAPRNDDRNRGNARDGGNYNQSRDDRRGGGDDRRPIQRPQGFQDRRAQPPPDRQRSSAGVFQSRPILRSSPGSRPVSLSSLKTTETSGSAPEIKPSPRPQFPKQIPNASGLREALQDALKDAQPKPVALKPELQEKRINEEKQNLMKPGEKVKF